ncbi:MAG: CopG family transcriptional regulator [Candidatus Thermoplasmatota archaeon]|nr:CopG family transcriptional regulator [Candidatus Thermoplasmatota archaeon]
MKRLSVALDDKSDVMIDSYQSKYNLSKSEIIRRALECLKFEDENVKGRSNLATVSTYIDFLANMEHVVVDIAHWKAIFSEIDEKSERFWNEVEKIGEQHFIKYYDKGMKDIRSILEYVEKTNWYKLSTDSENCYTLILIVSEASKFVKKFFEGFFKNYPRKVEITEDYKKIRIRLK